MALTPYLLEQVIDDMFKPNLYDQHFGAGLPLTFTRDFSVPLRSGYMRPWRHSHPHHSGLSNVINDKDSFKVNLDVQQFKPDELDVKVVDNHLVVEGKHEERSDEHGYVSRHFKRRYRLPENIDENAITSHLSSDGVLQLCAPKKALPQTGGRTIPIQHTNQPALKAKHSDAKPGEKMES